MFKNLCLHMFFLSFWAQNQDPKKWRWNSENRFACYNSKIIRNLIILFMLIKFGNIFFFPISQIHPSSSYFLIRVFKQQKKRGGDRRSLENNLLNCLMKCIINTRLGGCSDFSLWLVFIILWFLFWEKKLKMCVLFKKMLPLLPNFNKHCLSFKLLLSCHKSIEKLKSKAFLFWRITSLERSIRSLLMLCG